MSTRSIETEDDRKTLIRFLEGQNLPFTVNIESGKLRSTKQNKLQRQWMNDIAAQMTDNPAEYWRGYCKLHYGVPILRAENEQFCEVYDRLIRPLDYEAKIELMMVPMDMPITRIMTTRQKTAYLDTIWRRFSEVGVVLTDPGELLALADAREAERRAA